jgi:hypothetical protein
MRAAICCLLSLLFVACRTVMPPVAGDAGNMPALYEAALPLQFESQQTLVFAFRPHWWWPSIRMTALGYSTVNRPLREYTVVCLSPLGMKLFDVARSNGEFRANFSIPLPGNRKTAGQALDADISDLFFDLTPPAGAIMIRRGRQVVFEGPDGAHRVDYVFSADSGQLLSKTRFDGWRRVNTIIFSDPRTEGGRTYPATAVLRNHRQGYTLTLKTLSLR